MFTQPPDSSQKHQLTQVSPSVQRQQAQKKTRKKKCTWNWLVGLLAVVVLVNLGMVFLFAYRAMTGKSSWLFAGNAADNSQPIAAQLGLATPASGTIVPQLLPVATESLDVPAGVHYILLLGMDARPEEGTVTRTDTMMVARLDFENKTARLLSFPRDLWVQMPESLWYTAGTEARINQAHFYGELNDIAGGGPQAAMDTVRINFGIPIDGYARIDFQGFVQAVDALGGIDIDVPKEIDDYEFPTDDYGTMHFHVPAGFQHMDGLTALRYARTRHQDSDHERVLRQQLVMLGIRDTALNINVITKVPELWNALSSNVSTTLSIADVISYGLAGQKIPRENIQTFALTPDVLQGVMTEGGAAVFVPIPELVEPLLAEFMYDGVQMPPTPELTPYVP
jgi:LCP family protein required for cell wall assembly